jgi:hypothetical protein
MLLNGLRTSLIVTKVGMMFKGKIMNDLKLEQIDPKLVVARPTLKRHVRGASVTPSPSLTIAYALVYGLCGAVVAGHTAYLLVSYIGQ